MTSQSLRSPRFKIPNDSISSRRAAAMETGIEEEISNEENDEPYDEYDNGNGRR